jgi:hypothetical protein
MNIAFIGGGNMARALIAGLLRRDVPAQQLRWSATLGLLPRRITAPRSPARSWSCWR